MSSHPRISFYFVIATLGFLFNFAVNADTTWQGGTGDWYAPANWTSGLPAATVNANVDSGTAEISSNSYAVDTLTVGSAPLDNGTVLISGGTLTPTGAEAIGPAGTGEIIQTSGTNQLGISKGVTLGTNSATSGYGVYVLSGNGFVTGPYEGIVNGEFDQNGGLNEADNLTVGYDSSNPTSAANSGIFRLSAGESTADTLSVGGNGLFVETGGEIYCVNDLAIGASGNGVFSESAGQAFSQGSITIGGNGNAIFSLTGGLVYSTDNMTIGGNGSALISETGGEIYCQGNMLVTANGVFTQTAGQVYCAGNIAVQQNGKLALGQLLDYAGSLSIDSGTLAVGGPVVLNGPVVQVHDTFTEMSTLREPELDIIIGGPLSQPELDIREEATLTGNLVVELTAGFVPRYREMFEIISYGTVDGTFSSISLPSGSWGSFALAYTPTGVTLTVVPEPGIALGGIGFLFLAGRRQRRNGISNRCAE